MTHEDGDNDAIGGNDDERAINNVVEEEDGEWIYFLGGNSSSGTKKYQGSNSSDGGNTRDGVKIAGEVIGSGGEIGLEGDEEKLDDVLFELESSHDELVTPYDATARNGRNKRPCASFIV
ncbi:hypothetical protein Tco_0939692 [Tanacetum coccineum]|uniref:Uncharacterized protein n=1 Tax=Tanacetum coccineum TaxID=301880 RepID=A0ABQ5DN63_9ASTR